MNYLIVVAHKVINPKVTRKAKEVLKPNYTFPLIFPLTILCPRGS